ncbi:hypothetical protein D9M72_470680 [compost metagenome]
MPLDPVTVPLAWQLVIVNFATPVSPPIKLPVKIFPVWVTFAEEDEPVIVALAYPTRPPMLSPEVFNVPLEMQFVIGEETCPASPPT